MNRDEAVLKLRSDPKWSSGICDAYFDEDVKAAAMRFRDSGEFAEIQVLLGELLPGSTVLDIGAGSGIASFAFARAGARRVYALEPNPSSIVGRGAMKQLLENLPIHPLEGIGEAIELPDSSVHIAYCRAVLHHVTDLDQFMRECFRVLVPGGRLLATREHVVDDDRQLSRFLDKHPLNHLTEDENAYPLKTYLGSIRKAGLSLDRAFGPWDCVINAYPAVNDKSELQAFPAALLESRLGFVGKLLGRSSGVRSMVHRYLSRRVPGRLYSFLATKPAGHA